MILRIILLSLLCSMSLISSNFAVKSIILSRFGQGPFPKIAGKGPALDITCGKFSEILNTFLFLFSIELLVIRARVHKKLVIIANR